MGKLVGEPMTVMVDELRRWPGEKPRCFEGGSCHLTCDGDLEELHAFAKRLQLRKSWFRDGRVPHYDLTTGRRAAALNMGAAFVPAKEQARQRIAARATLTP